MGTESRGPTAGWIRSAWIGLVALHVLGGASSGDPQGPAGHGAREKPGDPLPVQIEVLPGVTDKLFDSALPERIPVAVLGSRELSVRDLDPATLVLSGAAATKNADGTAATYRDVNGDGREDLLIHVSSTQVRLGDRSTRAYLTGRTFDGQLILGAGNLRSVRGVRAERRPNLRPDSSLEKMAPREVAIDVLPGDPANRIEPGNRGTVPVAVLSDREFDATALDPTTLSLAGSPVTRRQGGGLATFEDVNGDGRADLVVEVPKKFLHLSSGPGEAVLTGMAPDGRFIQGHDRIDVAAVATLTFDSQDPQPAPDSPGLEFLNGGGITINDNAPATPYPSTLVVSGLTGVISKVRVTLHGLSHAFPDDIDILLVAPTGQSLILMSDVGGFGPGVSNVTLTFDDDAAQDISPSTNPVSGTYRPINFYSGPDPFAGPAPVPSQATTLSSFNGLNPNGTWSLYVVDDLAVDSGTIAGGWSLDFIMATEICNTSPITINDNAPAAPYPSSVAAGGIPGVVSKVTVTLKGLSHTFPDDIDMLLVGPAGSGVLFMSDVGGTSPIAGVNLVLDDNAALNLDPTAGPVTATYKPLNIGGGDAFPPPAPAGPYSEQFSTLDGTNPNGLWNLFVVDDAAGDIGSISGGWCVDITTMTPVENTNPASVTIPAGAPGTTSGPATPYPSDILVSGVLGNILSVTATLNGLTHTFPSDLDILLVAPPGAGGGNVLLMSDVGGFGPGVSGVNLTFDDSAGSSVPGGFNPASGTYRPTNDDSGGPDALPGPAPGGPYGINFSGFIGNLPNGTWSLYVYDDAAGDVGSLAGGWTLTLKTFLSNGVICNGTPITIPAGAPGTTTGPASSYPSPIFVFPGPVDLDNYKIRVDLLGLSHTYPQDLNILLVAPSGKTVLLMSDVGGGGPGVSNMSLSFDDDATSFISMGANPAAGVYKPTDFNSGADTFPGPAPPGPYGATLSTLKGTSPLGSWTLYIEDDSSGDVGTLAQGWCLEFLPSLNASEVPNLRWTDASTLVWDAGANANSYHLYRGDPSQLPSLQGPISDYPADSCLRDASLVQTTTGVVETPVLGSFYWFLVRGNNAQGEGHAGFMRIAGQAPARVQDSSGVCP